jgi:hypothetical protein
MIKNPYLDKARQAGLSVWTDVETNEWHRRINDYFLGPDYFELLNVRNRCLRRFSYAIPTDEVMNLLWEVQPILELGAGIGYWAWIMRQRGIDVIAGDNGSWHKHWEHKPWTDVEVGSVEMIDRYPDRTLLLVWPPYNEPFAFEALIKHLQTNPDKPFVFVGEWEGCCGDQAFNDALRELKILKEVTLPQWPFVHDRCWLFGR